MINKQLQEWIAIRCPKAIDVTGTFQLHGNNATSKAEFFLKDEYGIDFNVDHSMNKLLGFKKNRKFQGRGTYGGSTIVDIATVSQLIFLCNVSDSSTNFINGKTVPFLYNCGINVPAGYRLSRELTEISYKKLTTSQLTTIRIWIVNQNGLPINLRQDTFIVTSSLQLKRRVPVVTIKHDSYNTFC